MTVSAQTSRRTITGNICRAGRLAPVLARGPVVDGDLEGELVIADPDAVAVAQGDGRADSFVPRVHAVRGPQVGMSSQPQPGAALPWGTGDSNVFAPSAIAEPT
jgi:hypothetical protein